MNTDRVLALAQISISVVFLVGYFAMLALFLLGYIRTPVEWKDQLGVLIGVLTAGVMLVLNFWFSRHRSQEPKP
jgi:drug/metabolite transporter (DMT)-like permease